MFELAIKAGIPIIGVTTDDLVNFERVLEHTTGGKACKMQKVPASFGAYTYWTDDPTTLTTGLYEKLQASGHQLVAVNLPEPHHLVFDTGVMPTPEKLVRDLLTDKVGSAWVDTILPVVRGLSLKMVTEILLITQARVGNAAPAEIRRTRASLFGATQGLYLEDTSYDFYVWPEELKTWMGINKAFFGKKVHAKLIPRGIMFEGPPGVGKSMGSKAIANEFGVPLYRLDVASTLDKYIGVTESRVAKILGLVDREAPCVLLLDEVEKIFQGKEDTGVISRMLSQLLWWLAEHQSRVFTVMTTNDKSSIPPELYRQGRIDAVMKIAPLTFTDAKAFAAQVFKSVIGHPPTLKQMSMITEAMKNVPINTSVPTWPEPLMAHAEVAEVVYTEIKRNGWAT